MKTRNYTIFITLLMSCLFSCSNNKDLPTDNSSESVGLLITISKEEAKAMGLEFGKLRNIKMSSSVISSGHIDTPPQNKAKISSIVSGKVVKVNNLVGDYVKKGHEIIRLESIEFLEIQKNYISMKSNLKFLEDNYLRQKKLSEQNVSAKKVFYQAEKDYFSAKAEFEFISKKLDILQANKNEIENGNITPYLSIRSTINGYVTDIPIVLGEFVGADDIMFELINPEHLHGELNVYEKDVLKIKKGQQVEITSKIDTMRITGEVFLVGKKLEDDSRSVPVHVHLPDHVNLLPGMFIEGKILLDEKPVLAIPEEGLIREEERSFIYVLIDDRNDTYTLKKLVVIPWEESNGMVAIQFSEAMDTTKQVALKGIYYLSSTTD